MSQGPNGDNAENFFVFELLVENIRLERDSGVSEQLAIAVRLLDFPTLLIYQPKRGGGGDCGQTGANEGDKPGEYVFNRGKSCFFAMNLSSLHSRLSTSPLYTMVLDVKEDIPRLVGSSLISVANVINRIVEDVAAKGPSAPTSRGERGLVSLCSFTGEKIGMISLSYKLINVGIRSPPPAVADRGHPNSTGVPADDNTSVQNITARSEAVPKSQDESDAAAAAVSGPTDEHRPKSQIPQTRRETRNSFEEDLNIFCPPYLYYTRSAKEEHKNEGKDYKLQNLSKNVFAFEDSYSEEELTASKSDGPTSPKPDNREMCIKTTTTKQKTNEVNPNVLGDTLRQLPLLNALLVELSQLNIQNPSAPLPIHPNLEQIYRPAFTEPAAAHDNTPPETLEKRTQENRPTINCPPTVVKPMSVQKVSKQKEAATVSKISNKPTKLLYGTTKSYNLRLKQISTRRVRRECIEVLQTEKETTQGTTKPQNKFAKFSQKKSLINRSSNQRNIQQETTTIRQASTSGIVDDQHRRDAESNSEKPSPPEIRGLECTRIPTVDSVSVAQIKERTERHSESSPSPAPSVMERETIKSLESSRYSSRKSSVSDFSSKMKEGADYADDFTSLEPSDAYSPDPVSTTEPSRVNTPKSPVRPDSSTPDSASRRKRTVLPVPIKGSSPPYRSLRSLGSIKQVTESGRAGKSSASDSITSSRNQNSPQSPQRVPKESPKKEFVTSLEQQEAEETADKLGSLDFKKEYQHVSELIANKLPGYTM